MATSNKVRRFFGDADHDFQLNIGELEEIEEETGEGFGLIKARLTPSGALPFGGYSVRTVRLVLRLGLIGAGMDKEKAARLVEREVVPTRLGEAALLAYVVVAAAEIGVETADLGEQPGETPLSSDLSPNGRTHWKFFYRAGGALNWPPEVVARQPLGRFLNALQGFREANTVTDASGARPGAAASRAPTWAEHQARLERAKQRTLH